MANNFTLQLISRKELNGNTVHFEFKILENQSLELVAGQFIRLLFEQDGQEVFGCSLLRMLKVSKRLFYKGV